MGDKRTGRYRAALKTYKGSRSGSQARGTTGGSASSPRNNPSGGGKGSGGGSSPPKS